MAGKLGMKQRPDIERSPAQQEQTRKATEAASAARTAKADLDEKIVVLGEAIEGAEPAHAEAIALIRRTQVLADIHEWEARDAERRLAEQLRAAGLAEEAIAAYLAQPDVEPEPEPEPEVVVEGLAAVQVGPATGSDEKATRQDFTHEDDGGTEAPSNEETLEPEPEVEVVKPDEDLGEDEDDETEVVVGDDTNVDTPALSEGGYDGSNDTARKSSRLGTDDGSKPAGGWYGLWGKFELWQPPHGQGVMPDWRFRQKYESFPFYEDSDRARAAARAAMDLEQTDKAARDEQHGRRQRFLFEWSHIEEENPRPRQRKAHAGLSLPGEINRIINDYASRLAARQSLRAPKGWRECFDRQVSEKCWGKKSTAPLWDRVKERAGLVLGVVVTGVEGGAEASVTSRHTALNRQTFKLSEFGALIQGRPKWEGVI